MLRRLVTDPKLRGWGNTLLANQFVAGLRQELKQKLISVDGTLEELILKARFEEAKGREFAGSRERAHKLKEPVVKPKFVPRRLPVTEAVQPDPTPNPTAATQQSTPRPEGGRAFKGRCFNCGLEGHVS